MVPLRYFLISAFLLLNAGAFAQKELRYCESFPYYFRIAGDTGVANLPLFANYLNRFYTDEYKKGVADEFKRGAYIEKKKMEFRREIYAADFTKPYLLPVFGGEIGEYDFFSGGFVFNFPARDSLFGRFSKNSIFFINNIININEFDTALFFKMSNAESVKFIKNLKKKDGIPDRSVRFYCYYSIVNEKLMDDGFRNNVGMDQGVDIYLQKIVIRMSNGKRISYLPHEKFEDPADGFKTLNGKEYYYFKLTGWGNNREVLCSQNDAWQYYKVVEKKDGVVTGPVLSINRVGDTTATESCIYYYPAGSLLNGASRYTNHLAYGPANAMGRYWYPRTYIANYKNGFLDGATAYYTASQLNLVRSYEKGRARGYTIFCKDDHVDAVYLYADDKEVGREFYTERNQGALPDEVKKLFYEFRANRN